MCQLLRLSAGWAKNRELLDETLQWWLVQLPQIHQRRWTDLLPPVGPMMDKSGMCILGLHSRNGQLPNAKQLGCLLLLLLEVVASYNLGIAIAV